MRIPVESLPEVRQAHAGERLVLTHGVYDIIHGGHVEHLTIARSLGSVVAVALWSDEEVAARKGADRPFRSIDDRLAVIDALSSVDYVFEIPGGSGLYEDRDDRIEPIIAGLEPDLYLVSGKKAGYRNEPFVVHANGNVTSVVYDYNYRNKTNSTSDIAQKIRLSEGMVVSE